MSQEKLINRFIDYATENVNRAELFENKNKIVSVVEVNNSYNIILRSKEVELLFDKVVNSVKSDHNSQGFIYFLHQDEGKSIIPLYLGIARKKGKKNDLSFLFKRKCPRWEYSRGGNFHLSNLNSVVFNIGYTQKDIEKNKSIYLTWAKSIFTKQEFPIALTENLELQKNLYLSIMEWKSNESCFFSNFNTSTIDQTESVLIKLLYEFYPDYLLNRNLKKK